ncbi:MAG: sugar phosphate permease [Bryobacterales bacterium]|nr:sugar phosphate permease [Bryobacterales bacterium]
MKTRLPTLPTLPRPAGANRRAWLVCGLLLLATILNYLDRQVLSLTAERVIAEFHLDHRGFGEIVSWFRYSYAAVQLLGGWLVDALGPRLVFPLAVAFWSAAGMGTAWVHTLGGLRACRFALGIGEAFNWPCSLKTTEQLLEPRDRPLANGIFNSGTAAGAIIAPVIVTVLVRQSGWRSPFLFTGALGAVWVLLWAISMSGEGARMGANRAAMRHAPRAMAAIARRKEFWLLTASAVVINGASYFLADWIPLYLKMDRGFGFAEGNVLSILVYAGLDSGNIAAGYLVRRAVIRGARIECARLQAVGISCVLMSLAPLAGFTAWRYLALACIALTAVGVAGFLVIYLTTLQDLDPEHVGTVAGMLGGLGNLVYGMLTPSIGRLSDLHQTAIVFLLIGGLPWLAYLCIAPVITAQSNAIRT